MVTKNQLSVGMEVMARCQFKSYRWFPATITCLRQFGADPLVEVDITHTLGRMLALRHVNDIRLIDEAQDKE